MYEVATAQSPWMLTTSRRFFLMRQKKRKGVKGSLSYRQNTGSSLKTGIILSAKKRNFVRKSKLLRKKARTTASLWGQLFFKEASRFPVK